MAGIGFLLKNLIREDRYSSDIEANLYAVVISSGPWLFAVMCIAGLSAFSTPYLSGRDMLLFRAIITYIYAFSLIFSSLFQMVLTRFVSDRLYQREYSSLLPNFTGAMIMCGILSFSTSSLFVTFTHLNFMTKSLCVILFCAVSFQWIIMVFLSSIRDYIEVTVVYFGGFFLSFACSMWIGSIWHIDGYLLGFTIGQVVIVLILLERVISEFPFGQDKIFEFTRYFGKYPQLVWAGFLYNLGFWIDKIMMWYSPYSFKIQDSFHAHYPYDTASFLSILTIAPAMSTFFLQVEIDFYKGLRKYISVILNKGTYQEVEEQRLSLINILKSKIVQIIKTQFLVTLIIFLLAPNIVQILGFKTSEVTPVFMIVLLASFFQVLFLILIVIFWYLELLNESVLCISIFAFLNTSLNYLAIYIFPGKVILGSAYLIATIISFSITLIILTDRVKNLNYITFLKRPIFESQKEMPRFD